jgi:hypothetical protein
LNKARWSHREEIDLPITVKIYKGDVQAQIAEIAQIAESLRSQSGEGLIPVIQEDLYRARITVRKEVWFAITVQICPSRCPHGILRDAKELRKTDYPGVVTARLERFAVPRLVELSKNETDPVGMGTVLF